MYVKYYPVVHTTIIYTKPEDIYRGESGYRVKSVGKYLKILKSSKNWQKFDRFRCTDDKTTAALVSNLKAW